MALKINNLQLKSTKTNNQVFVDFDYKIFFDKNNEDTDIPSKNDIRASYDLNAIKNEISNLLNTSTYTRILKPSFGFSFKSWVGQNISQGFAEMQKMNIVNIIHSGSGRFKLNSLNIIANKEQQIYHIYMLITSPYFDEQQNFIGTVNQQGNFAFQ